jgi:hypothetical protein
MFRKFLFTSVVALICMGIAFADEFRGTITKVADGKVTFYKVTFDKETKTINKGAEQTLAVDDNVKVVKSKFNKDTKKLEAGDPVEGGLKNQIFTGIGEKGVGATIVTNADNTKIVEIRVGGFGKGKGN